MTSFLTRVNHYETDNTLLDYEHILYVSELMHFTQFKET